MTWHKRLFDVVGAVVALLVLWPVLAALALNIWLGDGRPILFSQERIGRGGRTFRILKFRTMRARSEQECLLTVGEDPRVTRIGQWMRRYKLDELPQLLNVLAGHMTLVGPRPEVPKYVAHYTAEQRRILDFAPGITDPASIGGWNESERLAQWADPEAAYVAEILPAKIAAQLDYCRRMSRWSDCAIILRTAAAVLPVVREGVFARAIRVRRYLIAAVHLLAICISYWGAYALRFDFEVPPTERARFWATLPVLIVLRVIIYACFGLYRGYWRHFGLVDLLNLIKAVTVSAVVFVLWLVVAGQLPGVPRSVIVIDWAGAIFLGGGAHFVARCLRELRRPFGRASGRRALVIGAGDTAEQLLRELERNSAVNIRVVGLIAEVAVEEGRSIHASPVVGSLADLAALATRYRAELIVIALDSPSGARMQRVVDACIATGLEFKTVPSLEQLLDGRARIDQLRTVQLQDLLGRQPVELDMVAVAEDLRHRVVLITGAAGSIGSELARQVARFKPSRLVLADRAESPLYMTELELTTAHPALHVVPVIGDVTDEARVQQVFAAERPDYVLHAAAYKHVPLMEANIVEAIRNNVLGTWTVAAAAAQWGATKFVLISTDKAVNPSSVMGASKRIAERLVLGLPSLQQSCTEFRAVRFGNVLGSNGSVVPVFERQLAGGGPIRVTHPEVERYFMTVHEAAELVLQAASLPSAAGRIAMLDMGRPMRIVQLAERMIRLAGLEPNRDIRIEFTGLRPGEKLQEELVADLDTVVSAENEKIRIVQVNERDGAEIDAGFTRLLSQVAVNDAAGVLAEIRRLVPECVPPLRTRTDVLATRLAHRLESTVHEQHVHA